MLDKLEPPTIPEGYGVSLAYYCLLDIIRSVHLVMMGPNAPTEGKKTLYSTVYVYSWR